MRSVDSSHEHEHDHLESASAHADRERLPRRISRKASSGGEVPSRIALADPPWSFANAVNAGIHAPIARKASGDELQADAGSLLASASSTSGQALPSAIQRKFESSLGADLSSVRVHTGEESAQASSAISARAYTTGQDIHFAQGQYDPSSPGGEHLLAHEVAHTVQQASAGPSTQCKLEISAPGDDCEIEADRAADAMTSGSVYRVAASAGVQRSVMRTPEDEARAGSTETAPPVASTEGTGETTGTGGTETATEGTGTGGTGGTGTTGPEMVATRWRINYDRIYRGGRHSGRGAPGERTESSILHVREFRVQPERDPTTPATPFAGYHLQNSGAVDMGTLQHPRNQGGEASASVSYMRDRDLHLRATGGDRRAVRALGGHNAIARRVTAELSRQSGLPDDVAAAGTALLTEAERAAGVTITARPADGGPAAAVAPLSLRYPTITDARTMDVMVEVPTGERRVIAESTEGGETETTDTHTEGATSETGREDESTTTDTTSLMTSVERQYQSTTETVARHVAEQIISGRLAFTQQFELGGEATAGLSGDLTVPPIGLDDLLGFIPEIGPWLAELLGDLGPQIGLTLTPSLQLQVNARSTSTAHAEVSAEQRTTDETSLRTAITQAMTSRWESGFEHQVSTTIRRRSTEGTTRSDGHTGRTVERHGSTGRTEGAAVSQLDVPRLVLRR